VDRYLVCPGGALAHEHVAVAGELEDGVAHRRIARVRELPAIERDLEPERAREAIVVLDGEGFELEAAEAGGCAGRQLFPLDFGAAFEEPRVDLLPHFLRERLRAQRPDDAHRACAAGVLPLEDEEREPEEVVPVVVREDDGIEIVRVEAESVERLERLGRGLEEVAAVRQEPVPAEPARREGVAGANEAEFEAGHQAGTVRPGPRSSRVRQFTLVALWRMPMHNSTVSYRVGIINVTGFAGMEAARLLWKHPAARIVAATGRSLAGKTLGEAFPSLGLYGGLRITAEIETDVDVVFSALPTAESAKACAPFVRAGVKCIDIAADFRLKEPGAFEQWMSGGDPHPAPDLLEQAVYGLPELNGDAIARANLVANPGCYPAASILALAPAFAAGFVGDQVVVDAKSGISGAGRGTGGGFSYAEVNEDVSAYKIANHNHQPEIRQELGLLREGPPPKVTFVPHLVPMTRGIHATCYAPLARAVSQAQVDAAYREFYEGAPFTKVASTPPHTKHTLGTNLALVHPVVDERNGMLVAVGVLDNLGKGAAGQAIENMNLMLGLDQSAGLDLPAVYP